MEANRVREEQKLELMVIVWRRTVEEGSHLMERNWEKFSTEPWKFHNALVIPPKGPANPPSTRNESLEESLRIIANLLYNFLLFCFFQVPDFLDDRMQSLHRR